MTIQKLSDKDICLDMIATEKWVSNSYDDSIVESTHPKVRKKLQQIQQEEQNHAEKIYKAMHKKGWSGSISSPSTTITANRVEHEAAEELQKPEVWQYDERPEIGKPIGRDEKKPRG